MDSIAVENYLKSLWQLGPDNVATLDLAQHLDVTPASATKMIKRLTEKGLVEHIPYKGASLTKEGLFPIVISFKISFLTRFHI